ncbi:hypothetical protein [Knoellia sp. LjRoot47]|uniref:hypothetical protein n=1 Tax=Knoellia sp. LjRoot47 TaxID=3342330 RepID=UPI003ECE5597
MTTGVGETVLGAEPAGARRSLWLRRLLGALVVAAWAAWAVPSWMSSLQEVKAHEVASDVRSGRVTGFQAVENVRPQTMDFSALGSAWYADVPGADSTGRPTDVPPRQLVYTLDGSTRTRWAPELYVGMPDGPEIFTALVDSGTRPYTPETFPSNRDWAAFPALFVVLMWVAGLVALPPTRGTRPFWVLSATVGMGLGFVAYAVAELWWPRTSAPTEPGPDGEDVEHRLRWFHGLGVAVVGGLVVAGLRAVIT